jgi:hypothetical protein
MLLSKPFIFFNLEQRPKTNLESSIHILTLDVSEVPGTKLTWREAKNLFTGMNRE